MFLCKNKFREVNISIIIFLTLFLTLSLTVEAEDVFFPFSLDAANDISFDLQQGLVKAEGDVKLELEDLFVNCSQILIDINKKTFTASGEAVILKTSNEEIRGRYLKYDYGENTGIMYGVSTKIGELNFKGGTISLVQGEEYDLQLAETSFTPCILPEPHYQVKAEQVFVYPDRRVVGKQVSFYVGKVRLFTLPSYVLEYEETPTGAELKNSLPMPHFGYNSKDGFSVEYYYPYQINEKAEGKIAAELNQQGDKKATIENIYCFNERFKLVNEIVYKNEIEDDGDISQEQLIQAGLAYQQSNFLAYLGLGYDFLEEQRIEELTVNYSPWRGYKLGFDQKYYDEELSKSTYKFKYQGRPLNWEIKRVEGYEVEYLPYLSLTSPTFHLAGLNLAAKTGFGRVRNKGITADKLKFDLNVNKTFKPTPKFTLGFKGRVVDNYYYKPAEDPYLVYQYSITASYQQKINQVMGLKPSLTYSVTENEGEFLLSSDKIEAGKKIRTGLDLSYLLPEPGSSWRLNLNGEYKLVDAEWEKVVLKYTRSYDCFSYSLDYNLIEKSIGISIDI